MKLFQPKLFSKDTMKGYNASSLTRDLIAGIIVAIIALPLSIALAIASGVSPEKGIYTAIVAGFVISFFGGSRVNISGPTAAFATIVAGIVAQFGTEGLVIATLMAGLMLILMGLCRFGVLIKYIPYTITTGFTSGIALTIVIGQVKDFLGLTFAPGTHAVETVEKVEAIAHSITTAQLPALLIGLLGLAILIAWPYVPVVGKKVPGSLIAVVVGTAVVKLTGMNVNTIGDLYEIGRTLPTPSVPAIDMALIGDLLPSAVTIAVLAAIESLLSCVVSDGMISDRHNSNTELIAQGLGNIASGLFGGIPATGAIARTAANVKNGGRTPVAGIVHALVLLLVLVVLMPFAAWIPMPIIASILFIVAYNMCEWRHFVEICKTAQPADILVLVVTFVLTVVFDLVVAIEVGMLIAVVLFMKRMADITHIRAWSAVDAYEADHIHKEGKQIPDGTEVYEMEGPMFFASSDTFRAIPVKDGARVLILRMRGVHTLDISAMRALHAIKSVCDERGITLLLSHVNAQPLAAMKRAGFVEEVGEDYLLPDIDAALSAAAALCKTEKTEQ